MSKNSSSTSNGLAAEKQERAKLGLLIVVALVFALAITYTANLQDEADKYNSDFFSRWYATQKLVEEDRNLYAWENGVEVLEYWSFPGAQAVQGLFFYPAYLLLFTLPLSFLPYSVANLIWSILIQLFLIAGLIIFHRLTKWPSSVNIFSLFLLVALVLWPNVLHTTWEQFNSIGLLGWALMYWAVRNQRFGWAGISAGLLLFKPQHTFFVLLFYFVWMIFQANGWRFFVALGGTSLGFWLFAELFQPGWVLAFFDGLRNYQEVPEGVTSVAGDMLGSLLWSIVLILIWIVVVWIQRAVEADSRQFQALQAFSLGVGLFIIPIVGMWHTIILYPAVILIAAGWRQRIGLLQDRSLIAYRIMLGLYYLVFLFAFLIGMLFIEGAEPASSFIWRNMGSVLAMLLALPLCFNWSDKQNEPALAMQ